MQRIYNILVSILGESKQGGYAKDCFQYQFNCCFCADEKGYVDNKYNLEINFQKSLYHCWSCESSGPLSKLISSRGGKALLDEYRRIIADIKENKYYNLDEFKDNVDFFGENKSLKLPKTFEKINLGSCKDKTLVSYLNKRKITQDIIDQYNIGRTTWLESDWTWRNRIIFPSYDALGDLNYFIGRTYKPTDKRNKYKNCDADKNAIILHEDKINPDGLILLVEGAIDCIYSPNTISLMGKSLNKKNIIYKYLVEKSHGPIYICLDSDTDITETERIYNILNSNLALKGRIWYIRMGEGLLGHYIKADEIANSDRQWEEKNSLQVSEGENYPYIIYKGQHYLYDGYKDFGELYEGEGKEGIIKAIKSAKQFSEFEMAKFSLKKKKALHNSGKILN